MFTIRDLLWLIAVIALGLSWRLSVERGRESRSLLLKIKQSQPSLHSLDSCYRYDEGWHAQKRGESNPYNAMSQAHKEWKLGFDDSKLIDELYQVQGD